MSASWTAGTFAWPTHRGKARGRARRHRSLIKKARLEREALPVNRKPKEHVT